MLTEVCEELNNYFDRDLPHFTGEVTVRNGMVSVGAFSTTVKENQYFRIIGSVFNDGVFKFTGTADESLIDEVFVGAVHLMAVPREVVKLSEDIAAWLGKYGAQVASPFASESLSASSYSYSKASIAADGSGAASWQNCFARSLKRWRKTRP